MTSRSRRDERGGVALIAAISMTMLLLVAALAVDLGMQRVARRDMQALADVVALDTARLVNGRTAGDIRAGSQTIDKFDDVVKRSVARNLPSALGRDPSACGQSACVTAYLVQLRTDNTYAVTTSGLPQEVGSTEVPDAVVVTTATEVGFAFSGITGIGEGSVSRAAVAASRGTGCFQLGSWLARIRASDPDVALGLGLLGTQLNAALGLSGATDVTALGYSGLADATLSVNDLLKVSPLNVGSADQLAATTVTAGQLLQASATALTNKGNATDAKVLTDLFNASSSTFQTSTVKIGDLLTAGSGAGSALATELNVFDLLTTGIFLANGTNFFQAPIAATVPGLTSVKADVDVISPPKIICGPVGVSGRVAQTNVGLTATIGGTPVTVPSVVSASISGDLGVTSTLGEAQGTLTRVTCDQYTVPKPDTMKVLVSPQALTTVVDGTVKLTVTAKLEVDLLGLLGVQLLNVTITADAGLTGGTVPAAAAGEPELKLPPNDVEEVAVAAGLGITNLALTVKPTTIKATAKTLAGLTVDVDVDADITALLNSVASAALTPVGTAVTGLNSYLRNDLPTLIGLNTAGADVVGVKRPNCNTPVLRG